MTPTYGTCDRCGVLGPLAAVLMDDGQTLAAVCSDCESIIDWWSWRQTMAALALGIDLTSGAVA